MSDIQTQRAELAASPGKEEYVAGRMLTAPEAAGERLPDHIFTIIHETNGALLCVLEVQDKGSTYRKVGSLLFQKEDDTPTLTAFDANDELIETWDLDNPAIWRQDEGKGSTYEIDAEVGSSKVVGRGETDQHTSSTYMLVRVGFDSHEDIGLHRLMGSQRAHAGFRAIFDKASEKIILKAVGIASGMDGNGANTMRVMLHV